jgi:uncharacterized protein (DUF1499 family)
MMIGYRILCRQTDERGMKGNPMEPTRILITASLVAMFWFMSDPGKGHSALGPEAGKRLLPCPGSPNCISSESEHQRHSIEPLTFQGPPEEALACLERVLMGTRRAKLVSSDAESLGIEFRTRLGFVDDASFALDARNGVIHMRSASRVGYWDLGANRRRLEKIRAVFRIQCP